MCLCGTGTPITAATNVPGGPVLAGDHRWRDRLITTISTSTERRGFQFTLDVWGAICLKIQFVNHLYSSFTSPDYPCKMKRVQARDIAGGSEISRNYAAWRASADFSVLLRDPRDLRVKGRAQSYSRRKRGTSRNYANSYLGI